MIGTPQKSAAKDAAEVARAVVSFELRERSRAAAAFDAMIADRRLAPREPPSRKPLPVHRATASELALLEDQRAGIV